MTNVCKFAEGFFSFYNCSQIEVVDTPIENFAKLKASNKSGSIFVWVQINPKWGTNEETQIGTKWNDERFPYKSVSIVLPKTDREKYTHYLMFSVDGKRACLIPASCLENAGLSKTEIPYTDSKIIVDNALIENWTPKLTFFIKNEEEWEKDQKNIWSQPVKIPNDPLEYLKSL